MPDNLIERPCGGCDGVDTDPRHVVFGAEPFHLQCHAGIGCTDCADALSRAGTTSESGLTGDALRTALIDIAEKG